MKAIILAAGLGSRLRPLTNTIPKPLLPVGGVPLIVWNLLLLRRHGIRDVIVNLHHLGHLIEKELGDGSTWDMRISYSKEPRILGTGGGLKQAEEFFEGKPFLVMNSDTLCELDVGALRRYHERQNPLATMVVREDPNVARWGVLELDADQRIVRINGRGRVSQGPVVGRMFAGVHIVHPRLLRSVPMHGESSIIDAYVHEIEHGESVYGYSLHGYWSDVGTAQRYADVQDDVERGLIRLINRTATTL
ncbi:MAG TPA: nucleotidyltransferase family protein [Nitrospiraceae bacterium]|nr:nucleotidyltransferase family protein [Nitrospiraceae bacterium]